MLTNRLSGRGTYPECNAGNPTLAAGTTDSALRTNSANGIMSRKGAGRYRIGVIKMIRWSLVSAFCLALLPTPSYSQGTSWEGIMAAGEKAYYQGRYEDAENLFLAGLVEAEGFGPQDSRLTTAINSLADTYRAEGRFAEAEPLYERALAIQEKALGPESPEVATTLNNLATACVAQGEYTEAEPLYERALAIQEKALGPESPEVAATLENYASLLEKTNRGADAAKLMDRAQSIQKKRP